MSGALFGHTSASGRATSKHLVEFRAGKMHLKGTTVTADKRKGLVYIYQSPDDSLIHLCWKDRTSGVVEDDLIIFPDDCDFKRITQCTTGRVYLLKFKSNPRRFFLWLQEPNAEKDDDYCKKVNDVLNNPPTPGSNLGTGQSGLPSELASLGAGLGDGTLQSMLGNVDQQQLMQLLGSGGLSNLGGLANLPGLRAPRARSAVPTTTTTATASTRTATVTSATVTPTPTPAAVNPATVTPLSTPTSQESPIQLQDLRSILSNMNIPADPPAQERVDLSQVLTSDIMAPILANPEVQQQLLQHAPEGENLPRDPERLCETLQSPQFQQAMNMFTAAFQSGQLGPLIGQFDLGAAATEAANKGDLEAFGEALQKKKKDASDKSDTTDEKKDEDKKDSKDKPDEDDSMQVD